MINENDLSAEELGIVAVHTSPEEVAEYEGSIDELRNQRLEIIERAWQARLIGQFGQREMDSEFASDLAGSYEVAVAVSPGEQTGEDKSWRQSREIAERLAVIDAGTKKRNLLDGAYPVSASAITADVSSVGKK